MKSKLLLLSFLMLFTFTTNYAQTSASQAGIAVQGIARDANNTALINQSVNFTFTIYYKSGGDQVIHTESTSIVTDEFGVFSHVIAVPADTNSDFANRILYLKIEDNSGVISDEVFKHVPYAVAANNGVPTGSIMPFVGTEAPDGWVICDGRVLTNIDGSANLIALLGGNNAPDLQGMFLRGTGTNNNATYANNVGPALNTIQQDGNKSHSHGPGNLSTDTKGAHDHTTEFWNDDYNGSGGGDTQHSGEQRGLEDDTNPTSPTIAIRTQLPTNTTGNHSHSVNSGSTGLDGIAETRPVSYGINYIIKL